MLFLTLLILAAAPADAPVPTRLAASKMTVPDGFRVTLFAGEPDIVQPIAFTFDDRGRMWVVECLSYPRWTADGKGHDRVVILEDTDGDGTFDKKTVVLDNGSNLSGIELGFGGMWLCSTPNLLFIPIKDDKPAGEPVIVLDGWNLKDAKHNVFNGLAWGPDGWLYGCNGIQTKSWVAAPGTPKEKRTYLDCGVWRVHPTRKTFEVVAHGTTNPWGVDWDEFGEMLITNCVIDHLWHLVPGGHYQRMYGEDPTPYTFGLMGPASDHKHWGGGHWTDSRTAKKEHTDAGGGHAHSGCCVYLGDNFPAEYRNSVFMCNLHGNRINRDVLLRTPTGLVGKHASDFLMANDPWFRGICIKQGPGGAMYFSDWSDTGECHNYQTVDASNGRLYRVTFGPGKAIKSDVSKMTDVELVTLQESKDEWLVRHARRVMQERAAVRPIDKVAVEAATKLVAASNENVQLRMCWLLHCIGVSTVADHIDRLAHKSAAMRIWSVRLLADAGPLTDSLHDHFCYTARYDRDPNVRRAIAGAARCCTDWWDNYELAYALSQRPSAGDDALMIWYILRPAVQLKPAEIVDRIDAFKNPVIRQMIVRCAVMTGSDGLTECLQQLHRRIRSEQREYHEGSLEILYGLRDGLSDRHDVEMPFLWKGLYHEALTRKSDALARAAEDVGLIFNDPDVMAALRIRIHDGTQSAASRRQAIDRLVTHKVPELDVGLRNLLDDPAVRAAAIRGLAAYASNDTPTVILKHYASFTAGEKADAVLTLASRPAFANALLAAVEANRIPKADVTAFAARQMLALNNAEVGAKLAAVWGTVRPASATRAVQTKKLKALLTPDMMKSANLTAGKAVFAKTCAACHKLFDDGGDVGPNLTGSQRANLDYVLENILDPNAIVPAEYKMTAFSLLDGRTVTGLVKRETAQSVTVRTVNETLVLAKTDIESRKSTPNSLMPEGLIDAMKDDEIRDLVAYLASDGKR